MKLQDLPYSERHIIQRARQILERHECEEALRFAEQNEVKPNMQNIVYYGAYLDGARAMLRRMRDDTHGKINFSQLNGKESVVYNAAILELISRDKHHMNMYLENRYDIMYRNHERDKKGRLVSVEAYFVKTVHRIVEAE